MKKLELSFYPVWIFTFFRRAVEAKIVGMGQNQTGTFEKNEKEEAQHARKTKKIYK